MVEMTLQVSDALATRIQNFGAWSATILELSLAGFKTSVKDVSAETVEFLSANPSPTEVMNYFIPDAAQKRLDDLLDLNSEGETTAADKAELEEWSKLLHITTLLKAQAGKLLKSKVS